MHPFYSLMGLIAAASNKMSRQNVNGLPLNWWLILGCTFVVLVASESRRDAISNGQTPQVMSVTQFLQLGNSDFKHRYVRVTGVLLPPMKLNVSNGSSHFDLVPLVDPKTKSGFFVHAGDEVHTGNKAEKATITGMMWGVPSDMRSDLAGAVPKFAPLSMDAGLELSEGQTPGNPLLTTLVMAGLGLTGGLFALSSLQKHVFFRRTKTKVAPSAHPGAASSPFVQSSALGQSSVAPDQPGTPQNGPQLRLSGKMRLSEKVAARFLEMPSGLIELEGGRKGFAARIDASTRTYGRVTQSRAGVWLSVPAPGTLQIEEGLLYAGARGKPALRLKYADEADKGKATSTVLSFNSPGARADFQRELAQGVKP